MQNERTLAGDDFLWKPKDGIEQVFWKNEKQFKSNYLTDDVFEYSLYVMGDKTSALKGFNVDDYEWFKQRSKCLMAPQFGATIQNYNNIRTNEVQKICPGTGDSCCVEDYYKDLDSNWMKIAKNDKDKVVLFIELISLFEKFLTTKNPETNKSILSEKLD